MKMERTAPSVVKDRQQLVASYALAITLGLMALTQLANFEGFAQIIFEYNVTTQIGSTILAITIIALEIFALPFLIRMWLSPLARCLSSLFVLLAPAVWLVLVGQEIARGTSLQNSGFFGTLLPFTLDGSALIFVITLFCLGLWSYVIHNGQKACKLR